jgi:hypothetical protein
VRGVPSSTVLRRLFVVAVLAGSVWVLGAGSARAVILPDNWCADNPGAHTCIVSASYNDGSNHTLSYSDPTYAVWASFYAIPQDTADTVQWSVQPKTADDLSAALGDTFSITIKTNVNQREMDGFGAAMTYARSGPSSGEYTVTLTGQPVSVTDQDGCTFPPGGPTCTPVAPGPSSVILQGEISDYNYKSYNDLSNYPAGFVASFDGMEMWTNIAETGLPPELVQVNGQNELQIQLTDHHEDNNLAVVHGDFYLRIPAAFLSTYWGINDPSTLATDGLNASIGAGGGTLTVTVEPGNAAVDVQISNMTFSRRHLKIKLGVVTPRAPTHVKAVRTGGSTARVTFKKSKPRGQKVNGYRLSCKPAYGKTVTAKSRRSPLLVKTLVSGQAYTCRLRGHSKAGYGLLSSKFSIRS